MKTVFVAAASLLVLFSTRSEAGDTAASPGEQSTCKSAAAGAPTKVKWHPGSYMMTYARAAQSEMSDIAREPYVRGVLRRYYWANLEPAMGKYDFSSIESDLNYLKAMPTAKRLVIMIMDRDFHGNTPVGVVPDYILNDPRYGGKVGWYAEKGSNWYGVAPTRHGYVAREWDPVVNDRWIALYRALGQRFDREPLVEAVASQELTPNLGNGPPPDYKAEQLSAQATRWVDEVVPAFPSTNVILNANFLGGHLEKIIEHCCSARCAIGGPDTIPTAQYSARSTGPTRGEKIVAGLDGGRGYVGKLPIMFMVSSPSLVGKEGPNTPEAIYRYATEVLGVTHLFWIKQDARHDTATEKYSWQNGILPLINATRGSTRAECPQNLKGFCSVEPPEKK